MKIYCAFTDVYDFVFTAKHRKEATEIATSVIRGGRNILNITLAEASLLLSKGSVAFEKAVEARLDLDPLKTLALSVEDGTLDPDTLEPTEKALQLAKEKQPKKTFEEAWFGSLVGTFSETGRLRFSKMFDFDFAIQKANCDLYVAGRLSRFIGEEFVSGAKLSEGIIARPEWGWCPILVAASDTLELRGKPNSTWTLEIMARKAETSHGGVPFQPDSVHEVNCDPYVEHVPQKQKFFERSKK